MTLMAADLNAELRAAAESRMNWTLAHLGTPRLMAMYAPSDNVRGFIFASRDDDGVWDGWTWFVLRGSSRLNSDEALETTAAIAVSRIQEFVARLDTV
ncbi:hypothetical protein [Nonomuraea wenchangensis]|uniref:hypothetical protein n=1 Tax=Nonomuraea wenchangensis TaxID=568860 RepID=UPI003329AD4A